MSRFLSESILLTADQLTDAKSNTVVDNEVGGIVVQYLQVRCQLPYELIVHLS